MYLEVLEEIKEQEELESNPTRKSIVCDGKVSIEEDDEASDCTIFIQEGEMNCSVGDYLALSPSNAHSAFRERKYIMEVKSCAGKHLSADAVWPKHERVPDELSRSPSWKIMQFPNLVSFNRMLEALSKLCTETPLENAGIFNELLHSWGRVQGNCKVDAEERKFSEEFPEEASCSNDNTTAVNQLDKKCSPCNDGNDAPENSHETFSSLNDLNPSQGRAVRQACNNSLTLIQGPPGTGKSKTSANIIKEIPNAEWRRNSSCSSANE